MTHYVEHPASKLACTSSPAPLSRAESHTAHQVAPASGSSITSKLLRSARGVGRQQASPPPPPPMSTGSLGTSSSAATAAHHRRRVSASLSSNGGGLAAAAATAGQAGGGSGGAEAGAGVGVVGMGEIEEEERRLQEKASKLEVCMYVLLDSVCSVT